MKKLTLITLTIFLTTSAYARGGLFGTNESIEKIQDVNLTDSEGRELYLAYKTTSIFFFLGVSFSDDGYVLGVKGTLGSYYPLTKEEVKTYQQEGYIPDPLPEYKIDLFDRIFGFSLWIVLSIVGIPKLIPLFRKNSN